MRTLFRYEMKKLFSGKIIVWTLLVVIAVVVNGRQPGIQASASGRIDGYRDIYARYEGQIVTDALLDEARAEYLRYVADHPDDFESQPDEEGETQYYFRYPGYSMGVALAYENILQMESAESRKQKALLYSGQLAAGKDDGGRALSAADRAQYEAFLETAGEYPVIHYAEGWSELRESQISRNSLLVLLALALAPIFCRERTSRMDCILLTAAGRRRAVWAKLLAAAVFTLAFLSFLIGLDVGIVAFTYGLDGASLPVSALGDSWLGNPRTIGMTYGMIAMILPAAALASAAAAVFSSSLFRNPLWATLLTGVLIGIEFLLAFAGDQVDLYLYYNDFTSALRPYLKIPALLPAPVLSDPTPLIGGAFRGLTAFGLSAALAVLLSWAGSRRFLRPRRA